MPKNDSDKTRRKIVVEEVGDSISTIEIKPQEEVLQDPQPVEPQVTEVAAVTESIPTETPSIPAPIEEYRQTEDEIPTRSSGPSPLLIIVPGIFLLGALLGGIVFYQKNLEKGQLTPTATETPSEAPEATATPSASVDVTKYNINILNGSGIKGEAGKVQELLEGDEFKVSGTGNAANYDYTETVIQAKSDVEKAFLDKLSSTLSKNYKVATKTESLSTSSKDSVVVIVGSSKK